MPVQRPHILIRPQERAIEFQSQTRGGGGTRPEIVANRQANARRVIAALNDAVREVRDLAAPAVDPDRLPMTMKAGTPWGMPRKVPRGNEVISVTGLGEKQRLNIALDPETLEGFERASENYADYDDGRRPNYFDLFEAQPTVRVTRPRDLWASAAPLPGRRDEAVWEVWLSSTHETRFREVIELLEIKAPRSVRLGSMRVVPIETTRADMERLVLSSTVAQLRPASSLVSDAYILPAAIQRAAIEAAEPRISVAPAGAPAICLLDTGIHRDHPLLQGSIDLMESVSLSDDGADWDGHGTRMAGLALFDNLPSIVMERASANLTTRIESVAVMPPTGLGDYPTLAALRVKRAVETVEEENPDRSRVFCLAWNTPEDGEDGALSSLSCEIDRLAAEDAAQRLFCVAGGNVEDAATHTDYQSLNELTGLLSPAAAWNALVVCACTDLVDVPDTHDALSPEGDLSPWSRTSVNWNRELSVPSKPDVVCEGGNRQFDRTSLDLGDASDLCLLTTSIGRRTPLALTGQTSAATASVAGMCAKLQAEYPGCWPESIRGLIVHGADYTQAMLDRADEVANTRTERMRALHNRFGAGRVNFAASLENAESSLTLVAQGFLHPLRLNDQNRVVAGEMRAHQMPWPVGALEDLGEAEVELRVTLSYFIEPDPSAGVRGQMDQYASYGFNFDMKRADETLDQAIARVNALHEVPRAGTAANPDWMFGPKLRGRGSLKFDRLKISAEDLARMDAVMVLPTKGWWADDARKVEQEVRYSLIVSIHTEETEIYTEIANEVLIG